MRDLATLRCNNHRDREAAALCTICRQPHCRECVTEHDGRVLCQPCLSRTEQKQAGGFRFGLVVMSWAAFGISLLSLVLLFALLGKTLLTIPSELHEGSVWQKETNP